MEDSSTTDAHVFISYVRNNKRLIQRLCDDLERHGVNVWLDRRDIEPGVDWKRAIRRAIRRGAFFIACFSSQYAERQRTYMNTELALAADELRERLDSDKVWFIPVLLSKCNIPDIDIGAGRTLQDLQYVELCRDWDAGIQRILNVIKPISVEVQRPMEKLTFGNQDEAEEYISNFVDISKFGQSPYREELYLVVSETDFDEITYIAWNKQIKRLEKWLKTGVRWYGPDRLSLQDLRAVANAILDFDKN